MEERLKGFSVPLLVVVGDEDFPCLDGSLFLKRTVPTAALLVVPRSGHTITSEEPAIFNAALAELFSAVESGRWMSHQSGILNCMREGAIMAGDIAISVEDNIATLRVRNPERRNAISAAMWQAIADVCARGDIARRCPCGHHPR